MFALWFLFLWPPCVADADIIFLPCGFFYFISIFSFGVPYPYRCTDGVKFGTEEWTHAISPHRCNVSSLWGEKPHNRLWVT